MNSFDKIIDLLLIKSILKLRDAKIKENLALRDKLPLTLNFVTALEK